MKNIQSTISNITLSILRLHNYVWLLQQLSWALLQCNKKSKQEWERLNCDTRFCDKRR